jgi:hypothetical protein
MSLVLLTWCYNSTGPLGPQYSESMPDEQIHDGDFVLGSLLCLCQPKAPWRSQHHLKPSLLFPLRGGHSIRGQVKGQSHQSRLESDRALYKVHLPEMLFLYFSQQRYLWSIETLTYCRSSRRRSYSDLEIEVREEREATVSLGGKLGSDHIWVLYGLLQ